VTWIKDRPINLLELRATYTTGGGPDKTILLSAERHDKTIVNPIVVYLKDKDDNNFQIGRMAEGRGFKYIEVLDRGKIDIKCIIELNEIVRKYKIDIIHGHDYKTDILAYILGLLNPKVHLVSTAHGWIADTLKGSLYKWLHLIILRRFKNLITVSQATKQVMVKSGINADKIRVVYNGIDEKHWNRSDHHVSLRKEWRIPEDSIVVGTVGRIGNEKDYFTFLNVAKVITDQIDNVFFVIVGEGKSNEKEELVAYAEKTGIRDKVIFTGYREDLLSVYKTFDIFLMTSITEGLPNTMLEALSMGLPVVSTNVGGVKELMADGETGFLCKSRDVVCLVDNTIKIIKSKELRESTSKAARARILNQFSFDKRLQLIEKYYVSILSNNTN